MSCGKEGCGSCGGKPEDLVVIIPKDGGCDCTGPLSCKCLKDWLFLIAFCVIAASFAYVAYRFGHPRIEYVYEQIPCPDCPDCPPRCPDCGCAMVKVEPECKDKSPCTCNPSCVCGCQKGGCCECPRPDKDVKIIFEPPITIVIEPPDEHGQPAPEPEPKRPPNPHPTAPKPPKPVDDCKKP